MINIDDRVLDTLNESEVYLCLQIARYMKSNRMTAWPSLETLSKKCNWDERTVKRWRVSLERKGFLDVERVPGKAATYRFRKAGFGVFHAMEDTPAQAEEGGTFFEGGTFYDPPQKMYPHPPQKMYPEVVNKEVIRDVVSHETTALSSKMDAGQQGVESSKIHGMAASSEISVELHSPPETETIETPCGTTLEIEAHPPANVETVSKTAYSPDFEAFWKAYRFPVGSKAMASQKWKRLSDSERASALAALPVHIQSTTTDRNRPRNAEFLPMRCHAVVYLSQKRWEAYADSMSIAVGSSAPTKWDAKYKGYLQTCKQRWPGALETVSFLSKAEYCAFQEGRYLKGISMVGTDMQKSRLMRCHDRWEAGESAARTHSSIWACFLAEMSSFIEKSKAV